MSSPHALLSFISFIQKSPSTHIMASKEASLSKVKLHITHNVRILHQRHIPHLFRPVGAAPGKTCFGKEVVVDILVGEQFAALYEGFQNAEVDFLIRPFIFRCCAKVKTLIIRLRWKISGRWGIMEASPKEHVCQRAGR